MGWSHDVVGALDAEDGSVRWIHEPTSFQNNSGAIAASPAGVVIGPFGGAVLEVIGPDGTVLASVDSLADVENLRQIGPFVDDHLLVRFSFRDRQSSLALLSLAP